MQSEKFENTNVQIDFIVDIVYIVNGTFTTGIAFI